MLANYQMSNAQSHLLCFTGTEAPTCVTPPTVNWKHFGPKTSIVRGLLYGLTPYCLREYQSYVSKLFQICMKHNLVIY